MKILTLYRQFLVDCEKYTGDFPETELLKKRTMSNLRKKQVDSEDLPALLYLLCRMRGAERYRDYRHAVVDEAQDFGEFDLFVLQKALSRCHFTVVGDLAQAIYSYRGTESWDNVLEHSFARGTKLLEMSKSYRTTVEIMETANRVSDVLGLPAAVPVIRHGSPVAYYSMAGKKRLDKIGELIRGYLAEGHKSIAVLDKSGEGLASLREALISMGIEVEAAAAWDGQYSGGVCVLPCYLSKGLEFDCVILLDASEKIYRSDRRIDMHLLYVAMTRPLHRLDIFYGGELTAPLRDM